MGSTQPRSSGTEGWPGPSRVYVRIVNFNTASEMGRLIESLPPMEDLWIEILDNGSDPSQFDHLRDTYAGWQNVTIHRSERNLGFGAGHNLLHQLSSATAADYIWLLNPDTVSQEKTLGRLLQAAAGDPGAIYSPVIYKPTPGGRVLWFSGGRIDRARGKVHDRQAIGTAEIAATAFITGASPFMRRSVYDRLGGFDPDLFLYWEDVDLSLRAQRLKIPMKIVTGAVIFHEEGASSKGVVRTRANAYYYISRNRILTCRKPGTRGVSLVLGLGAPTLLRLLAYSSLREGEGRRLRAIAILRGAYDALRTGNAAARGAR